MWSEHRFLSFDATPIFTRVRSGAEAPQAVVLILHGMGEHGGRYQHLADYLSGLGILSILPDLRGFGRSGGRRASVTHFSDYHRDVAALEAWAGRQYPDTPQFIFGHSFGGLIASSYVAFERKSAFSGLILSSPLFGLAVRVPMWRHALGLAASWVWPHFTQPNGVDTGKLTHDALMMRTYGQDMLIDHRISARLYRELCAMLARKRDIAARIHCPALIVQAGEDRVVSAEETQRFYDRLTSEDRSLQIYPGLYHEVLNETERAEIFSRIGVWIRAHIHHK